MNLPLELIKIIAGWSRYLELLAV